MKLLKTCISLMATLFLCGCFQVEDELSLQPDGSGKVTMTLHSNLPEELIGMLGMSSPFGGGSAQTYPPVSEAEARRFFPQKDFTVKAEQKSAGDGRTLVVEASFKNVIALLASPYGRAHQLTLRTNGNGALNLLALSGGSILAQAAQFKPEGESASLEVPGIEDAQKKKGEMRFEFRVVLPNTISEANGARQNKTVTWVVERSKCKDDEEFANKLAVVLEASCSSEGLMFSPITPTRLGLLPFSKLSAGKAVATTTIPDTNKIVAAARFVPCVLQVTRTLDLSGEGSGQGSQAQLIGAIFLPAELAPQRWGEAKLEEAIDSKGNSLMPKEEADAFSRGSRFGSFDMPDRNEDEDPDESAPQKQAAEKPHMITLNLKAPEWKIKEVARIKGVLELQYFGGSEVVKVSNAVPASLVMDMSKRSSRGFTSDSERGQIVDSRLAELGLSLRVQMAMVQSGITMLSLETSGGKAALVDAQVFDADGHPWPTSLMQSDSSGGEDRSCQLLVAGRPMPPFSLALAVGGLGASVGVPILVENVAIGAK